MSNFDIRVSLEETARLAWEEFREAWSFQTGGIGYGWLYDVQKWTMAGGYSRTAKMFADLWDYMRENMVRSAWKKTWPSECWNNSVQIRRYTLQGNSWQSNLGEETVKAQV